MRSAALRARRRRRQLPRRRRTPRRRRRRRLGGDFFSGRYGEDYNGRACARGRGDRRRPAGFAAARRPLGLGGGAPRRRRSRAAARAARLSRQAAARRVHSDGVNYLLTGCWLRVPPGGAAACGIEVAARPGRGRTGRCPGRAAPPPRGTTPTHARVILYLDLWHPAPAEAAAPACSAPRQAHTRRLQREVPASHASRRVPFTHEPATNPAPGAKCTRAPRFSLRATERASPTVLSSQARAAPADLRLGAGMSSSSSSALYSHRHRRRRLRQALEGTRGAPLVARAERAGGVAGREETARATWPRSLSEAGIPAGARTRGQSADDAAGGGAVGSRTHRHARIRSRRRGGTPTRVSRIAVPGISSSLPHLRVVGTWSSGGAPSATTAPTAPRPRRLRQQ